VCKFGVRFVCSDSLLAEPINSRSPDLLRHRQLPALYIVTSFSNYNKWSNTRDQKGKEKEQGSKDEAR
jgi:hypothetical protein